MVDHRITTLKEWEHSSAHLLSSDQRGDCCSATLTATIRLRQVTVSSSVPTDIDGSKMAPVGSTKETVMLSLKVMFSFGRYRVLPGQESVQGGLFSWSLLHSERTVTHL